MSPAVRWILAIVGLLAGNVAAMVILMVSAHADKAQIIPDYYEQAAHYDDVMAQDQKSSALAWQTQAKLDGGQLSIDVRDARGEPLTGAKVSVEGFHRAHAAERFALDLAATAPGSYRGSQTLRAGLHDLVVRVQRGDAVFVERLAVEAR